jgi:hypothetical protein
VGWLDGLRIRGGVEVSRASENGDLEGWSTKGATDRWRWRLTLGRRRGGAGGWRETTVRPATRGWVDKMVKNFSGDVRLRR